VIDDSVVIAKSYLKGWFAFDIFVSIPWDSILQPLHFLAIPPKTAQFPRMFRIIRLSRITKVLRVLKVREILRVWNITLQLRVCGN